MWKGERCRKVRATGLIWRLNEQEREVTMSDELNTVRIIIPGRNVAFYTGNQCSDSDHVIGKRYFQKKMAR